MQRDSFHKNAQTTLIAPTFTITAPYLYTLCRFAHTRWSEYFVCLWCYSDVEVGALGVECLFAVNANEKIQQKTIFICVVCFNNPFDRIVDNVAAYISVRAAKIMKTKRCRRTFADMKNYFRSIYLYETGALINFLLLCCSVTAPVHQTHILYR